MSPTAESEASITFGPLISSSTGRAPMVNNDPLAKPTPCLELMSAQERISWAFERFEGSMVLSTSFGIQAAVMLHLVVNIVPDIPVVFVDTGYLFPETYKFADALKERLNLNLKVYSPLMTPARQEALYGKLWEQGTDGLRKYGLINKVEPMERALRDLGTRCWLTGVRRSQSSSRSKFEILMRQSETLKLAPIVDWSDEQVDEYLQLHDLPNHPLRSQGYVSLGDWHSTSKLIEGMAPEDTRFNGVKRECGLHEASNIPGYRI